MTLVYNPQKFKRENFEEAIEFIGQNPFATVISTLDNNPIISHIPLTLALEKDKLVLYGHMAKANPHWKYLALSATTAIFHGAHTYITPKWYAEHDVPTWNYSVAHVTGKATLMDDYEGTIFCLQKLVSHIEKLWSSGWDFQLPNDLQAPNILTKNIVGFKLLVEEIQCKRKLSQNRSALDRKGVIAGLKTRTDDLSHNVREDMLRFFSVSGELK